MPSKKLILVTGINGFLGSHIVDQLMKAGYRVRATVRTAKVASVRENNAMYGSRDRLSQPARTDFPPAPPKGSVDNTRAVEILKLGKLNDWKTTLLDAVDSVLEVEKKFALVGKSFH